MSNVSTLKAIIADHRLTIVREFEDNPTTAAVAAYDAVTTLLIAVVNELRETREQARNA